MTVRLLEAKKCIQEYFTKHLTNPRKWTAAEWLIANNVCIRIDPVAEVTTRIQGGDDAFVSQSIVLIEVTVKTLRGDTQGVRMTGAFADGTPTVESVEVDVLSPDTQHVKRVLINTVAEQTSCLRLMQQNAPPSSQTRGTKRVTRARAPKADSCSRLSAWLKSTLHGKTVR